MHYGIVSVFFSKHPVTSSPGNQHSLHAYRHFLLCEFVTLELLRWRLYISLLKYIAEIFVFSSFYFNSILNEIYTFTKCIQPIVGPNSKSMRLVSSRFSYPKNWFENQLCFVTWCNHHHLQGLVHLLIIIFWYILFIKRTIRVLRFSVLGVVQ